jgi:uncharacterized protein (TIGR03067 family)
MTGDLKKLQGTWTIVALETDGNSMSTGGSKIVLNGERFTTISMGGDYAGSVELDAKKKPKTFDLLFTSGPHQGEKSLGIYELDGDTWKICLALAGIKTRPKAFATTPGSGLALEILKRGEVTAPAEPTTEAGTAPGPATGPATEMEGEWEMISGSIDGVPLEASLAKYGRRISQGDQLTVRFGPQVFVKTRFITDPSKSPQQIDYIAPSGGKPTQLGIYAFDGGTLMVSMAPKGKPRPIDFTATKTNRWTVTVWTLVKK